VLKLCLLERNGNTVTRLGNRGAARDKGSHS
jgi:hypothetical protein